jgi:hypothetical protein
MIFEFLRKLTGNNPNTEPSAEESVVYNGYAIQPTPRKDNGGWRIQGIISKEIDSIRKDCTFIRADAYAGKDDALAACISKAKRIIDEQGDAIFRD